MRTVNFHSPVKRRAPLNRGLLRWWMALPQRHGGLRLQDLMAKSPMTLSGALRLGPRGRPGGFGSCVFDGTDDYGQTAAIDLSGISTMTVALWHYSSGAFDSGNDLMMESSDNANNNVGAIQVNPNIGGSGCGVRVHTGTALNSSVTLTVPTAQVWHHWVFCFDRGAGSQQVTAIYIDGVSQTLTPALTDTTGTGGFGNYAWNFASRNGTSLYDDCRLDDIRIYNRVLPAWEVRALLRASRRGYPQELRWSRGAEFGGYVEAAPPDEPDETETFSVGGAGPLGAEEIPNLVLADATSLTVPAGAKYATVQAVGANFNYFISGDAPTTGSTGSGRKLYNYGMIELDCGLTSAKFIREGDTANSKLVVEYYSRKTVE